MYQYPGGWIADRYGRRRALVLFVALAMAGYVVYWLAPSWPFVFLGLVFVMAWALFAVIGDALPRERALGFTVQSVLPSGSGRRIVAPLSRSKLARGSCSRLRPPRQARFHRLAGFPYIPATGPGRVRWGP